MTSPTRLAMIRQAAAYLDVQKQLVVRQAEMYAACDTDTERAALVAHFAEANSPEQTRARATRLARAKRRHRAAERGAKTVPAYGARTVDMTAFEAQFLDGAR